MKKRIFIVLLFMCIFLFTSCVAFQEEHSSKINSDIIIEHPTNEDETVETDIKYTVTTSSSTDDYGLAGTYTMINSKEYAIGEEIHLYATVNSGYNFEGWYIEDVCLSTELNCKYTVRNKNVIIDARFSNYTINTKSSTDSAGAAGKYTNFYNKKVSVGETVELTATVNEGYNFEGWYINGNCVSRNLNYSYIMGRQNVDIWAEFSCYKLTTVGAAMSSLGNVETTFAAGTYTQYSNKNISAGETIVLSATVNDGYNFVGWFVGDTCVSSDFEYTFVMDKSDVIITARYSYYILNTTAQYWDGWYNAYRLFQPCELYIDKVYTDQKISRGTSITVTAQEVEGWDFIAWKTDETTLCQERTYTFEMPAGDFNLYALYSPQK